MNENKCHIEGNDKHKKNIIAISFAIDAYSFSNKRIVLQK